MSTPARNFRKSTLPGEVVDRSDCGSRGRVLGAVGVFETGMENSSELVRSFDVAFPPREEVASWR